jgi:hypothetical protein
MESGNGIRGKGLSPVLWVAQVNVQSHMQSANTRRTAKPSRRQTKDEAIASFVGFGVQKDSIAIAIAEAGREASQFIGTAASEFASWTNGRPSREEDRRNRTVRPCHGCQG